ncbi:MAG: helix-turn-helix domain-containing protein [Dehalococcoidia bacterium]
MTPLTCSLEEASRLLGVGRSKAYELARTDSFPTPVIRIGRRYLVPKAPLLEFLGVETIRPEESAA